MPPCRLLAALLLCAIALLPMSLRSQQDVPLLSEQQIQDMISQRDDSVVVLHLWATWCKPCIEELPVYDTLATYCQGKPVRVVLLSLDFVSQREKKVLPFVERRKVLAPVAQLSGAQNTDFINGISPEWSGAIPATLVVDRSTGRRIFHEGSFSFFELQALLQPLLSQ